MDNSSLKSEIRDSIIRELIEKVRKQNYKSYLISVRLEMIRLFNRARISFDFPVTALIGPNGGGKSTILGVCSCIYASINPYNVFRKRCIGDGAMDNWKVHYELIDKETSPKGAITTDLSFEKNQWKREHAFPRRVKVLGINRTVPAIDNPQFSFRQRLSMQGKGRANATTKIEPMEIGNIEHIKHEAERVLGKSLSALKLWEVTFAIEKHHFQTRQTEQRQVLNDGRIMLIQREY